jgi:hypothetical protein
VSTVVLTRQITSGRVDVEVDTMATYKYGTEGGRITCMQGEGFILADGEAAEALFVHGADMAEFFDALDEARREWEQLNSVVKEYGPANPVDMTAVRAKVAAAIEEPFSRDDARIALARCNAAVGNVITPGSTLS